MKDYSSVNKNWWNKVVTIHSKSNLYNLKAFKKGKTSLQLLERKELGNVKGKKLLHLMCHFGMDTLSWARLGADVIGVDFSEESIKFAKKLSKEIKTPAKFICSDIYDLEKVLGEKYDIIFMSYGALCWLRSLKKLAKLINHFLLENGIFYIAELHPFTNVLSYDFKLQDKYFSKGPFVDDSSGTYTDWDADIKGKTYIWSYTLSEVINSLIKEGLKIDFVHEFPFAMYEQFPGLMQKDKRGLYTLKDKKVEIPLLFSLKAIKS